MAAQTLTLDASQVGGLINAPSGPIQVPSTGRITAQLADVPALLRAGCNYLNSEARVQLFSTPAPIVGAAGQIVASAALTNGTKTIANQPDVPRLARMIVDPGTTAITAGNVAVTYKGNDGQTVTDNLSPITAASTTLTTNLSRGMVSVTSVIVTAMAGGASPGFQVDTTNYLAAMVAPNYSNFVLERADIDGVLNAGSTVNSSAACVLPSTAPNGTHTYSLFYTFDAP